MVIFVGIMAFPWICRGLCASDFYLPHIVRLVLPATYCTPSSTSHILYPSMIQTMECYRGQFIGGILHLDVSAVAMLWRLHRYCKMTLPFLSLTKTFRISTACCLTDIHCELCSCLSDVYFWCNYAISRRHIGHSDVKPASLHHCAIANKHRETSPWNTPQWILSGCRIAESLPHFDVWGRCTSVSGTIPPYQSPSLGPRFIRYSRRVECKILIGISAFLATFQQSVGHAVTISGIWGVYVTVSLLILQIITCTPLGLQPPGLQQFTFIWYCWQGDYSAWSSTCSEFFGSCCSLLRNHLWPAVFHCCAPFTGCQ